MYNGPFGTLQSKRKLQQEYNYAWQLLSKGHKVIINDKMNELKEELKKKMKDDKPFQYYGERGILLGDENFEMQISLLSVSEEEKQSARNEMKERRLNEEAMEIIRRNKFDELHTEKNALFKRAREELMKKEEEKKAREEEEQERKEQEKKAREEEEQVRMKQEREEQEMMRKELERKRMEQKKKEDEELNRMLMEDYDDDDDDDDIDVVYIPDSTEHTITATIKYINGESWEVASFNTYDVACLTDIITGTYHVRNTDIYFRFHRRIADEVKLFMNSECLHHYDKACFDSDSDYDYD